LSLASFQWPFKIKLYKPGVEGGDAVLTYEDATAAASAPSFFNGAELKGRKIGVTMASAPPEPVGGWQGGGGGGGRRY
jgi:RNA-binding protein FUS